MTEQPTYVTGTSVTHPAVEAQLDAMKMTADDARTLLDAAGVCWPCLPARGLEKIAEAPCRCLLRRVKARQVLLREAGG